MTNNIQHKIIDIGECEKLELIEITGTTPGPTVAVIGGIHGDEEEGVLSVRRLAQILKEKPISGKVRLLPVANPAAYRARNRFNPIDNKNLAREFPGSEDGTVTGRTAHVITNEVIAGADAMIDLHSAGIKYAMELFCGFFELGTPYSEKCAKLAHAFGTSIIWAHTELSEGRSLSAAVELDVPAIYLECGGGGEVKASETDAYVRGLLNVLISFDMLDGEISTPSEKYLITDAGGNTDQAIMAPVTGIIVTHVAMADSVKKDDRICDIYDDKGCVIATINAPAGGVVMLLRREAPIDAGEVIAMISPAGVACSL
ncbi:MAG: hypothetical protein HOH18_13255 [Kordiimonadaceae bacterium]|jgi:predicted deacylase|nr:hypothetical protein [Kordiimonadaceae bacterium]MBT6037430.1 hypothetical protein [Kordiimonadaceae bacterium]